jgi:NADH-quinone oxidoreductase subunit M
VTAWINSHLLSFLIFTPVIWGLLIMALPQRQAPLAKLLALMGSTAIFFVALIQLLKASPDASGMLMREWTPWFTAAGLPVDYSLSADGLNVWLVILTTFLTPLTLLGTWNSIEKRAGAAMGLFLVLEGAMLGALLAQDLLLFYVFFLIGIWGGQDRKYAATKFMLFTLAGSLIWLVALLFVAGKAGGFAPALMAQAVLGMAPKTQYLLLIAFTLAFAIKVPLFPLHTWLPDAHTEAPTMGSVILAGVLLKLGPYGILRFAIPIFPAAFVLLAKPIAILSVIAIVYGALVAMVQWDIKKLVAYSSVSHMGFVMLGIASLTTIGTQGAMLQMLNHGISTGALFLLVGMIYDRAHTRMIADFGGVATKMPLYTAIFLVVTLSSIGLPLTNGFVGEFLILNGSFVSGLPWGRLAAGIATLGVLLSAAYMLWMFKRVFWGPANTDEHSGTAHLHLDLNAREVAVMVPIIVLIFWMGLHPQTFLGHSQGSVEQLLKDAKAPAQRSMTLGEIHPNQGPEALPSEVHR